MASILEWMLDQKVSNGINVVAFIVTILGFGFTLWGVWRSARAADAAKSAAEAARSRLVRTDAVAQFAAAIGSLDELKRLQREKAWSILLDRYSSLKQSLIAVRAADSALSSQHRASIQGTIQHLSNMERKVEDALPTGAVTLDVAQLNRVLSKQIETLTEVLTEIKNELNG